MLKKTIRTCESSLCHIFTSTENKTRSLYPSRWINMEMHIMFNSWLEIRYGNQKVIWGRSYLYHNSLKQLQNIFDIYKTITFWNTDHYLWFYIKLKSAETNCTCTEFNLVAKISNSFVENTHSSMQLVGKCCQGVN